MHRHSVAFVLAAAGFWLGTSPASAQVAACSQAYEKAQEEKAAGRLNSAIAQLKDCVDTSCPGFIREDCSRWMNEAEAALPSVVFAVRRDGKDQLEVEVTCDGAVLAQALDGKAIPVDPGPHNFTIRIPGFDPIERQLLVREGERNRMVEADFRTPRANPFAGVDEVAAAPSGSGARRTTLTYGLAGVGALGVGGFALFAVLGSRQQSDLEHRCAPACSSAQVDSVKTKYLVADLSLGIGVAALGAATYLLLTNRGGKADTRSHATVVGFAPRTTGPGGVLELATSF
jgi:hypothetical protein